MIKCLRARRGNVHRKKNCFRGVLLFKTHFAEFCVKSVCKTEPWNWAVRRGKHEQKCTDINIVNADTCTLELDIAKLLMMSFYPTRGTSNPS